MRNRILYYSIFILFGVSTSINAQRLYELTPYSFYQEWSLVEKEFNDNLLVYKPKASLNSRVSTIANHSLSFSRKNNIFYSINPKPDKERALDWTRSRPRKVKKGMCPTGTSKIYRETIKNLKRSRKKGIWSVYLENDSRFLVLEHKVSQNGKAYSVYKKEEFQIVSLEEDRMILRKVNNDAENF